MDGQFPWVPGQKKSAEHDSHHCPLGMFLCGVTQFLPPPSFPSLPLALFLLGSEVFRDERVQAQSPGRTRTGNRTGTILLCGLWERTRAGPGVPHAVHQGSLCLIPCRMRVIYPRRGLPPQVCGKHVPRSSLECSIYPAGQSSLENSSPPRWSFGLPSLTDQRQALNCLTCLLQLVCRSPEVLGAAEERSGSPLLGNESAHMPWLWEMFLY